MSGRFAPSPTGDLHLGNLRTALAAWLAARSSGRAFVVRMEDLDLVQASRDHELRQLEDLEALGIDHDGAVVRQSDRFDLYRDAIERLERDGLVYPCWCSRREIAAAVAAPHGEPPVPDGASASGSEHRTAEVPPQAYPGTCRELSAAARRQRAGAGRPPARRLRTDDTVYQWDDAVHGTRRGRTDDFVLQRADGVPSYNVAVVVDDALQGVTQVVRGDDLVSSTARQLHLQQLLGFGTPEYAHVPLVLGPDGDRLAKRHGAVTLADLATAGVTAVDVLRLLGRSLAIDDAGDRVARARTARDLLDDVVPFDVADVPRHPIRIVDLVPRHLVAERSVGEGRWPAVGPDESSVAH